MVDWAPDPEDAVDVLAFVFCPAEAFAPAGDEQERRAVNALLLPMKTQAIERWQALNAARRRS